MKVVYNHSGTYKAVQPLLVGIAEDQRPFTGGYKRSSKWPCLKPQRLALRESRPSELPDHLADVSHSSRNVHGAQGVGDALEDVQRLLPGRGNIRAWHTRLLRGPQQGGACWW